MPTATASRWRACPVPRSAFATARTPEDRSSGSRRTSGMLFSAAYGTGNSTVELIAAELGSPAEFGRVLVVGEFLDRARGELVSRQGLQLAPGKRPGHHRRIAYGVLLIGGPGDDQQRAAGRHEARERLDRGGPSLP